MTPEITARFHQYIDTSAGMFACWPWTGAYSKKRGKMPSRPIFWVRYVDDPLTGQRSQLIVPAARMALSLYDGVPLHERVGLEACHVPACSNPACVNYLHHLYWGTPEQNRMDRYPSLRARLGALIVP